MPSLEQLSLCLLWKLGCLNIPEAGLHLASSLVWALHPTTFTPRSQCVVSVSDWSRSPSLPLSPHLHMLCLRRLVLLPCPVTAAWTRVWGLVTADFRPPSFPLVLPGRKTYKQLSHIGSGTSFARWIQSLGGHLSIPFFWRIPWSTDNAAFPVSDSCTGSLCSHIRARLERRRCLR